MNCKQICHCHLVGLTALVHLILLLSLTLPSLSQQSIETVKEKEHIEQQSEKIAAESSERKAKEAAQLAKIRAKEAAELAKIKEKEAEELAKLRAKEAAERGHHTPPAPTPPAPVPPVSKVPTGTPEWPLGSGCYIFPNSVFNADISNLPVNSNSATWINIIGGDNVPLHPDFGTVYGGALNGQYINIASAAQPKVAVTYNEYGSESDPGPFPIPSNAVVEGSPPPGTSHGGGDAHCIILQPSSNLLVELYHASPSGNGSWTAGSGAKWDVSSNQMRPLGWTSSDAAGLPITPILTKYEEAAKGSINHALRLTVNWTQPPCIWPASHSTASVGPNWPPMGARIRLKAEYNTDIIPGTPTSWSPINRAIVNALAHYGAIIADNNGGGAPFFLEGAYNPNWNDGDLHLLGYLKPSMFDFVDESSLMVSPTSFEAATGSTNSVSAGADGNSSAGGGTSGIQVESHHNSAPRKN